MAFELSVAGFFAFITRPFTNWTGIFFMILVGFYIWLRISGRLSTNKEQGGGGGSSAHYRLD